MAGTASISSVGIETKLSNLAFNSLATLAVQPVATISVGSIMSAVTSLSPLGLETEVYPLSLQVVGNLSLNGNKVVDSTQLAFSSQASLVIQVVLGSQAFSALATLISIPGSTVLRPNLSMVSLASLNEVTQKGISSTIPIHIVASLIAGGQRTFIPSLGMVVHGSLIDSGRLLLDPDPELLATAKLSLAGLSKPIATLALVSVASLIENVSLRDDSILALHTRAALSVSNQNQLLAIVPMSVEASLELDGILVENKVLPLVAHASLQFKDGQVIFEGPYLVVPGINNSTMSFEASSFPIPRTVRNTTFTKSIGNVIP
jgi:hypothetical protein